VGIRKSIKRISKSCEGYAFGFLIAMFITNFKNLTDAALVIFWLCVLMVVIEIVNSVIECFQSNINSHYEYEKERNIILNEKLEQKRREG
jgi:diacylglycerol kinase